MQTQTTSKVDTRSEFDKVPMEWTREKTLILIDEYRNRRGLWDMTHEDYRKKDVKRELLDQVSQKFDGCVPTIEIEKKFHTLRTQYHREINRMQQTRGNDTYKSKWFAFKHLQFLSSPKACRAGKAGIKVKLECEPIIDKDDDEPATKFIIKEVPIQSFTPTSVAHTISAEFLTEKACEEETHHQSTQKQPTEAERKRDLETLFEDAAKNVGEQTDKVIIKHINVPVHYRGAADPKVVHATFETQEPHEVEEHHLLETHSPNQEQHIEESYQNHTRVYKAPPKRDLYEEVMQYDEDNQKKTTFYEKVQSSPQPQYSRDECSVYGEYVANELRFITSRDILVQVKHKINTALFEASMAQLHKNS